MTKDEVKREYKEMEGSQEVKQKVWTKTKQEDREAPLAEHIDILETTFLENTGFFPIISSLISSMTLWNFVGSGYLSIFMALELKTVPFFHNIRWLRW